MNSSQIIEQAYASIKQYVPDDAAQVLNRESKRVSKVMDDELAKFKKEMNAHIAFKVEELTKEITEEMSTTRGEIKKALEDLQGDLAKNDKLTPAVEALKKKLDSYDSAFASLGKKAREAVL